MLRTLLDRRAAQPLPPGWGEPARTHRPARRPRLLALVAAFLVVAAWLTGQLTSNRGWLMVALAWLLVLALTGHRDAGGRRHLLRTLGEYAAVAALAVLLVTGPAAGTPQQPAHRGRATADAASQLCPDAIHGIASSACDLIDRTWRAANQARQQAAPTTTTPTGKDSR